MTLPGRPVPRGRLHISTQTLRAIYAIFADLGFQVYRSREVEDDETNFDLLNMPPHHPARDMWDTFHTTTPGVLLRTHTSPGQIHVMRELCPEPIRVILPGMCYRYEAITTRSEIMFHQVEGLAIGEHVTMADLKGTIIAFARRLFGDERQVRIRSSYFPFTEPSIEVDIDCIVCDRQRGCGLSKGTGWLEIMGAGMVHPVVLRNGGYDPEQLQRLRLRHGPAAHHHAEVRHRRHPAVLGQRSALLAAIRHLTGARSALLRANRKRLLSTTLLRSLPLRTHFSFSPLLRILPARAGKTGTIVFFGVFAQFFLQCDR